VKKELCFALALGLLLSGCGPRQEEAPQGPGMYTTVVHYSGEDDDSTYLQIARRSQELVALLEEEAGGFVMDAYNFQSIDDEGTPLYTMNTMTWPEEIAPNGRTIRVSKNYFLHNPIETADGADLAGQFIYDDKPLNIWFPSSTGSRRTRS